MTASTIVCSINAIVRILVLLYATSHALLGFVIKVPNPVPV